ncbi:MAG TPA: hypothetical protein VG125_13785 [Pirellulales bacterium]|jgi:hypothetical protein|nr:hypothetical protein [Pirellulales bacterium]
MIAPLQTEAERSPATSDRLAAARAALAGILLRDARSPSPPIVAWKAWLFVAWVAFVTVVYALLMSGLIRPGPAG